MIGNEKDAATALHYESVAADFLALADRDQYGILVDYYDQVKTYWESGWNDDDNTENATVYSSLSTDDGWISLGSGMSRSAWLSPEGVVYKVPTCGDMNNRREWARYQSEVRISPSGRIRLPDVQAYEVEGTCVLAAEYIERPDEFTTPPYELETECGQVWSIRDVHLFNIFPVGDDEWVLIDFAQ